MIGKCKIHGETKFYPRKEGGSRCGKCSYEAVKRRRKKRKLDAVDYKGGQCEKCGYDKCIEALEFHHLDPTEKDFEVASSSKPWAAVTKELDKCIMVCANCHRELHYEERNNAS